ncbi:MAG: hypothetical protein HKP37_07600 [Boseongicola sp.]|nr:hypothetical protein [Boseongicola sp.]
MAGIVEYSVASYAIYNAGILISNSDSISGDEAFLVPREATFAGKTWWVGVVLRGWSRLGDFP